MQGRGIRSAAFSSKPFRTATDSINTGENEMTATVLKANGEYHGIEPKNGKDFSLEEAQGIVGGYVEVIHLSSTQLMIVNEEGLLRKLPYNQQASLIAYMARKANAIVGDVLVCDIEQFK